MTNSQRQLQDALDSHAERVTQIMKHCETHKIKFSHHEPLKYAAIKMHGLIEAALALGMSVSVYKWAYTLVPEVTNYFTVPQKPKEHQRPRVKHQQA